MKHKEKLMRIDVALQTALVFYVFLAFTLKFTNNWQDLVGYSILIFGGLQVLNATIIGFLYNEKGRLKYLKILFWTHVCGTAFAFLIMDTPIGGLGALLFVFIWMFLPFFYAIWNYTNALNTWKKALNS